MLKTGTHIATLTGIIVPSTNRHLRVMQSDGKESQYADEQEEESIVREIQPQSQTSPLLINVATHNWVLQRTGSLIVHLKKEHSDK
jgi:hypothetical protein